MARSKASSSRRAAQSRNGGATAQPPVMVSFGWSGEDREIRVVQKNGKWVTTHIVNGQPDPLLIRMFGTNEVPTPWASDVDRETVVKELSVRNTHARIS